MVNLTKGKEIKQIFLLFMPLFFGNIFQQIYKIVEAIIVGLILGVTSLGAIGIGFIIMSFVFAILMGMEIGIDILVAQYFGARDLANSKKIIISFLILIIILSLVIGFVGILTTKSILLLLKTPKEILPEAVIYLRIIFMGLAGIAGFNIVNGILRAIGDSKGSLYFLFLATGINIILDLIFILGLKWEIMGIALATVVSQGVSFLLEIIYLNKKLPIINKIKKIDFDKYLIIKAIKIGLPICVEKIFMSIGTMVFQAIINSFGVIAVAALTIGMRIDSFSASIITALSMTLLIFTGHNFGAGKSNRIKKGYWIGIITGWIISLLLFFFYHNFGREIISLFNKNPEVIKTGYSYIKILSTYYFAASFLNITLNVIRGIGNTLTPMFIMLFCLWVIRIPSAKILSNMHGIEGIFVSIPLSWVIGAILTIIYFSQTISKRKTFFIKNYDSFTK